MGFRNLESRLDFCHLLKLVRGDPKIKTFVFAGGDTWKEKTVTIQMFTEERGKEDVRFGCRDTVKK